MCVKDFEIRTQISILFYKFLSDKYMKQAKYLQIKWLLNADIDEYLWLNSTMDNYEKPIE